jgi:hypothetical protein
MTQTSFIPGIPPAGDDQVNHVDVKDEQQQPDDPTIPYGPYGMESSVDRR